MQVIWSLVAYGRLFFSAVAPAMRDRKQLFVRVVLLSHLNYREPSPLL